MLEKAFTRRHLLKLAGVTASALALGACQPKIVEVTKVVEVEKQVEKIVKETVVVKEAVEVEKEVTRVVEKQAEAAPAKPAHVVLMYNANEISDDEIKLFNEKYAPYEMERIDTDLVKLYSMLAAGTPVDVFRIYGTYVPGYVLKRVAKDITDYFDVSTIVKPSDLLPVNDLYVVNGRRYGMVKDWSPDVSIFANKALWDEAGVSLPAADKPLSLQEWRALSPKLTKKEGDRTMVMGTDFTPNEHVLFWITNTYDPSETLFNEDFSKVRLMDNPKTVEFVKFWFDWMKEKGLPSAINAFPSESWSGQDWVQGQAATVLWGYWFSGMAESDKVKGDDIYMMSAPTWGPTYANPCVTGCGAVVTTTTQVPDAAWKVFEWFLGEEPAINRAKSGWGVPGLTSMLPLMPVDQPWRKRNFDMVNREIKATKVARMQYSPYITPDTFKTAWGKYEEPVLKGTMAMEDLLQNVEKEVNEAIVEGMDRAGVAK